MFSPRESRHELWSKLLSRGIYGDDSRLHNSSFDHEGLLGAYQGLLGP